MTRETDRYKDIQADKQTPRQAGLRVIYREIYAGINEIQAERHTDGYIII